MSKLAYLQENIATAFLNKGLFVDAAKYFDRTMESRGYKINRNKVSQAAKILIDLMVLIKLLYFSSLSRKKALTNDIIEDFNFLIKKATAVSAFDLKRFFLENINTARKIMRYDVSTSQRCTNALSGASSLFSTTGLFKISRKILDYSFDCLQHSGGRVSPYLYKYPESIHNYLTGKWDEIIQEELVKHALMSGDFFPAAGYPNDGRI